MRACSAAHTLAPLVHTQNCRWSKFLSFLDTAGLLTDKVQSRTPAGPETATLDELRAPGGGGQRVAAPKAEDLATNAYLPA